MRGRHIGGRLPLRLALHIHEGLVVALTSVEKPVGAFLQGRSRLGRRDTITPGRKNMESPWGRGEEALTTPSGYHVRSPVPEPASSPTLDPPAPLAPLCLLVPRGGGRPRWCAASASLTAVLLGPWVRLWRRSSNRTFTATRPSHLEPLARDRVGPSPREPVRRAGRFTTPRRKPDDPHLHARLPPHRPARAQPAGG